MIQASACSYSTPFILVSGEKPWKRAYGSHAPVGRTVAEPEPGQKETRATVDDSTRQDCRELPSLIAKVLFLQTSLDAHCIALDTALANFSSLQLKHSTGKGREIGAARSC